MPTRRRETGLGGKDGYFDTSPAETAAPPESEEKEKAEPEKPKRVKRTTIILDNETLDLIDQLRSIYRRQDETATQSDLCAWGIALLAQHKGIKTGKHKSIP